jgi:hypothetical protein
LLDNQMVWIVCCLQVSNWSGFDERRGCWDGKNKGSRQSSVLVRKSTADWCLPEQQVDWMKSGYGSWG